MLKSFTSRHIKNLKYKSIFSNNNLRRIFNFENDYSAKMVTIEGIDLPPDCNVRDTIKLKYPYQSITKFKSGVYNVTFYEDVHAFEIAMIGKIEIKGIKYDVKHKLLGPLENKPKDWSTQYMNYLYKWSGEEFKAEHRVDDKLEGMEEVFQLDVSKNPLPKSKFKKMELVTLTDEEKLKYAQMVRHIESEYEMQWGEVTRNHQRWDKDWPRHILPDGTPLPHLETQEGVDEWKRMVQRFETDQNKKSALNSEVSQIIQSKENIILMHFTTIKALLNKLLKSLTPIKNDEKTKTIHQKMGEKIQNFKILEELILNALPRENAIKEDCLAFFEIAKNGLLKLRQIENDLIDFLKFSNEKIISNGEFNEIRILAAELAEILLKIQAQFDQKEKEINYDKAVLKDPRLKNEENPKSPYRLWNIILKHQQEVFEDDPHNIKAVNDHFAKNNLGVNLDKETDQLELQSQRKTSKNTAINAHFNSLCKMIQNDPTLTIEQKVEFYKKIPSTIGGPGPELPSTGFI